MILSFVVAVAENGVIGRDNRLPWHIPEDLRHFRALTLGKPIIMGRKTYESIGKPLPGRRNLVVTRNAGWSAEGVEAFPGLDEALAAVDAAPEAMLIGGAELYRHAVADRIYLTQIHRAYDGDTFFSLLPGDWIEVSRERHEGDPAFSFVQLDRRR